MSGRPTWSIYLQAPTDVLLKRLREQARDTEDGDTLIPDATYLQELNEAYQHFFFHYTASPLLVVETSSFGARPTDAIVDDLIRQIEGMTGGTRYYVPRGEALRRQRRGTRHPAPHRAPSTRHPAPQHSCNTLAA